MGLPGEAFFRGGNMVRKGLTILVVFCIILVVSSFTLLPWLVTATLQTRLTQKLATNDVQVELASMPTCVLVLGQVDKMHIIAHPAQVGTASLSEVTLEGTHVMADIPAMLTSNQLQIRRANSLELRGIIDAEGMRRAIAGANDKLENVQVDISSERVLVTAQAKIMGKMADIELEGVVRGDYDGIYFDMTRLNIHTARLGTAKLGEMFGNITLAKRDKLPLGLRFDDVQQTDGAIIITAVLPSQAGGDKA